MNRTAARIIAVLGVVLAIGICMSIYFAEKGLYSISGPPNRAKSYGTGKFISDVRLGWCNNDGKIIERNFLADAWPVTVFLQNFDGWLLDQGRTEPRILPSDLTQDDLKNYLALVDQKKKGQIPSDREPVLQSLQAKLNHWFLQERSNLRLMIAAHVFESIPPFDTTAPPTHGTGEYIGETYNRVVFLLAAPKDPK